MESTKKSSIEKPLILMGIDVHKNSWEVRFGNESLNKNRVRFERPFVANLANYVKKHFPETRVKCAYEAGFSGFWAKRALEDLGFETLVVNPADIPTSGKDRDFKTDKRDSRKILAALRSGELQGIYCPSVTEERDRAILRARAQIAKSERQAKNRIKSTLLFYGIDIPEGMDNSHWSKKFLVWLNNQAQMHNLISLTHQLSLLNLIRKEHSAVLLSLRKLSREERHEKVCKILESTPGIGPLTSIKLKLELISMDRFSSTDKLLSYIGFVPTTNHSGESVRMGKMTKRGRSELRRCLIESAWIAIRYDPELGALYENWKKKKSANKAIVKVAVKLVRRIRYIWIHNEPYKIAEQ